MSKDHRGGFRQSLAYQTWALRGTMLRAAGRVLLRPVGPASRRLVARVIDALLEHHRLATSHLVDFSRSRLAQDLPRTPWCRVSLGQAATHNIRAEEIGFLAALVAHLRPRTIFEIGTFNGYGTLHLAENAPADSRIFTLDLPPREPLPDGSVIDQSAEDLQTIDDAKEVGVGALFRDSARYGQITQLYGDSRTFDYSPWYGSIDLCVIDGCHSYEYVKSDSANALRLLSDRGVIVWHDYDWFHPDVFRHLHELAVTRRLFFVDRSSFAVYIRGEDD